MKRWFLVSGGIVLCGSVGLLLQINSRSVSQTQEEKSPVAEQEKVNQHGWQAQALVYQQGEQALQNIHKHLQQAQQPLPKQDNEHPHVTAHATKQAFSRQLVHQTRVAFTQMAQLRTHADKYRVRQNVLDELLQNPKSVSIASSILIDNEFARNQYGKDQAVARIYSIELLHRLMQKGDKRPLVKTVAALTKQLASLPEDQRDKGRLRDLEDLLGYYFKREDTDIMRNQFEDALEKLGYHINLLGEFEITARSLIRRLDITQKEFEQKYVSILLQGEE